MNYIYSFVLLVTVCSHITSAGYVPPYIKPCHYKEANFEKCVAEQIEISLPKFTKGIPELDVPSLEPIHLDDINIDGNGLKLAFTNADLHGLSEVKVVNLKVNLKDNTFELSFKGNATLTAQYKIDGQILILPIRGQGNSKVKARNLDVTISSKINPFNDSNGQHMKLTSPTYTYNIEKTKFEFQNLFNGNKPLSDATHAFANENWRQIMDDVAPPAIKKIVKTGVKSINKFFAGVTIDDVIIGYDGTGSGS